jgi:cell wall-associated NlpC family hydrolase
VSPVKEWYPGVPLIEEPIEIDEVDGRFEDFPLTDPKELPPDGDDSKHGKKIEAMEFQPITDTATVVAATRHINPSGLSSAHRIKARDMAIQAMALTLQHASAVHYTQGSDRWEGIAHHDRAWRGQYPHHGDCSSTTTWALWCGLSHFHRFQYVDLVNGLHWKAGYTGTQLRHGRSVAGGSLQRCDLVLYGNGWPGEHVAMYIGGGLVISHGSEGGPYKLSMHYRGDIIDVRRYI